MSYCTNCGCNYTTPTCECGCAHTDNDKEYLLVSATSSEPALCGTPGEEGGTEDCDKQEPMFDVSLSSFLLPNEESSTTIEVCNASVYAVGMWIQFIASGITLQITNITGNYLTVVNKCDIDVVPTNPGAGYAVSTGSTFIVADKPPCDEDSDESDEIEICRPNLETCSATATVQPVGNIISDTEDLGVNKCIRKIFGFLMRSGTPIFNSLQMVYLADLANYRRLVKHKTNHEVKQLQNYCEDASLVAGQQYVLAVQTGQETLKGPTYILGFAYKELYQSAELDVYTVEHTYDIDMEPEVTGLAVTLDHYYVMCRLDVHVYGNTRVVEVACELNGVPALKCANVEKDGMHSWNSIAIPIKVMTSDHKLTISVTGDDSVVSAGHYTYTVSMDGIYY